VFVLNSGEESAGKALVEAVMETIREKIKQEAIRLIIREAAVKIAKYLSLMRKKYSVYKDMGVVVTEKLDETETTDIIVMFKPPEWIEIRALLIPAREISRELVKECDVLEMLMMLSNDFAELSFCMDKDGNIYAKQNILVGALTFDVFKEEYDAVYLSTLVFKKQILPKLRKCIRNYEEIKNAYSEMIT